MMVSHSLIVNGLPPKVSVIGNFEVYGETGNELPEEATKINPEDFRSNFQE
jgi:hypothetical protein